MATVRKQLRDAVALLLTTASADTDSAIFGYAVEASRVEPLPDGDADAPAPDGVVLVFAGDRADAPQAPYGMGYISSPAVNVHVQAYFSAVSSGALEVRMDAIEESLEAAILGDQTWLDSLAEHPTATWQFLTKDEGGRFRGLVALSLACRAQTVEVS